MSPTNSLAEWPDTRYPPQVARELTSKQKKQLRGAAQRLDAMIKLGKNGLAPTFITAVNELLEQHELIKIKFGEFKDEKKELTAKLVTETGATFITQVGHTVVLYRENPDAEKRKIKL